MTHATSMVALAAVGAPAAVLVLVGGSCLAGWRFPERVVGVLVKIAFVTSLVSCVTLAAILATSETRTLVIPLGEWFATPGYRFGLSLLLDGLSLTFATLTAALCGLVAAFAHRYLHREPGYHRFFILLAVFALGMMLTVLAGTIEMVYGAWELVGLSSALLIAFYQERRQPLENGFRAFAVYRICDLGLLTAVVLVHHFLGTGSFDRLYGAAGELHTLSPGRTTVIALLFLLAALGKSALLPVSGWLPRAMEGPTPSSAIFYGALSVHAGIFLLLRAAPFLERAPLVSWLVVIAGLLTALHAALLQQVQTDIKGALAYASLTQVGIIVAEVGLGLRLVALVHVVGHAFSRSLQFLRAPSLLHDFHETQRAIRGHRTIPSSEAELATEMVAPRRGPSSIARPLWLYRFALERAYLDELLSKVVVRPFTRLFRFFDAFEQRWIRRLDRLFGLRASKEETETGTGTGGDAFG